MSGLNLDSRSLMNRLSAAAVITSLLFCGCGAPDEIAKNKTATQTEKVSSIQPLSLEIESSVLPISESDKEFSKQIQTLSREASEHQINFDFAAASSKWREAETLLTQQFGASSWQTVNARVAAATAATQAGFTNEQSELLKTIFQKQAQVSEGLRNSDIPTALRLSEESTEMSRALFGEDSFMMGKQLMQLARMNQHAGNVEQATEHFVKAVQTLNAILGDCHPDLEMGYAYLGEIYLAKGDSSNAIASLTRSTEIARKLWGEGSLRFSARANDLGVAYYRGNECELAGKVLRVAEAIRRKRLTANHPQVAHSLTNLGAVYIELNQNDMADQCLTHAHSVFMQHYGTRHRMTSDCKSKLATVRLALGDAASAEKLLSELITSIRDESSPQVIASLQYRLATALTNQEKLRRAEPLFKSALRIQKETLGESDERTITTMRALSLLLSRSNRHPEASEIENQIQRVAQVAKEDGAHH